MVLGYIFIIVLVVIALGFNGCNETTSY
ncbi:uncharacterized protein G2W53_021899 [Senna tora]|uniref:Uncharacterized protein n=1 Tax=Senna tora TaxID=362788 RepID=A0A834TL13_9FABA|nr:uncharacterized protein G2W53_021899 [Senna tora]